MDVIRSVISALELKQAEVGFQNLSADERLMINQYQILESYVEWLKSPLAQQSYIMVKILVERAEKEQRVFITECCEKYQKGVAII